VPAGWVREHAARVRTWLFEMTSVLGRAVQFGALLGEEGARVLALAQTLGLRLMATRRDWPTT
jgi:hypothetical protein